MWASVFLFLLPTLAIGGVWALVHSYGWENTDAILGILAMLVTLGGSYINSFRPKAFYRWAFYFPAFHERFSGKAYRINGLHGIKEGRELNLKEDFPDSQPDEPTVLALKDVDIKINGLNRVLLDGVLEFPRWGKHKIKGGGLDTVVAKISGDGVFYPRNDDKKKSFGVIHLSCRLKTENLENNRDWQAIYHLRLENKAITGYWYADRPEELKPIRFGRLELVGHY